MYTNADCTVYNKYKDKWYSTHLYGVFWSANNTSQITKTENKYNYALNLLIPVNVNSGKKKFQPAKEYNETGWTLKCGDIVVFDIADIDIKSKTDLINAGYEVYSIDNVEIFKFGSYEMQHYEVGGN